jgi:uncharacterized protein (DUF983 family)
MMRTEFQVLPGKLIVFWRGFRGSCPNCGKGKLFRSYLAQNAACPNCGEDFSAIHADDGPAWFVMLLTGAIVMPPALYLAVHELMPDWAVIVLLLILTAMVALLLLPRAKGLFIAILWRISKIEASWPDR